MAHLLVLYGTSEGQTRKIATFITDAIRERAHTADLVDASEFAGPLSTDVCDGVIVGVSVRGGQHQASVKTFVMDHRSALQHLPSAFFSVSLAVLDEDHHMEDEGYVTTFLDETGWSPDVVETVVGALLYTKYGIIKRYMMKQLNNRNGRPTNSARDFQFTDWDQVDWEQVSRFVDRFLQHVESPERRSTPSPQTPSPT